jgi:hypothetical protein
MRHFLPSEYDNGTVSIFQRFLELNRDFQESIVIAPRDFLQMSWGGYPIEILFIDLEKKWKLNKHVIANFFPHLFPGSIVIQQDYVHFGEPWVALTMEYLEEYFDRLSRGFHSLGGHKGSQITPQRNATMHPFRRP